MDFMIFCNLHTVAMGKDMIEHPVEFYDAPLPRNGSYMMVGVPMFAYKVFAPPPIKRELNMFQKAVLGIMQVGTYTASEIAEKLKLDRDLILLIQAELMAKHLVAGDGTLTPKGSNAMRHERWDETTEVEEFTIGYIYQDPISSRLLPRFITRRKLAEISQGGDGNPDRIVTGTKGSPEKQKFSLCNKLAFESAPKPPSNGDIFQVIRKHASALEFPSTELISRDSVTQPPKHLKKLALLDDQPVPTWLLTYIYTPESSATLGDWQALDPFGLGESLAMRSILEGHLRADKELKKKVENLLVKQNEDWRRRHRGNHEELIRQANIAVQEKLGLHNLSETIERHLSEFEFQYQDFLVTDTPNYLPIAAQKVLETMMQELANRESRIFRIVRSRLTVAMRRDEIHAVLHAAAAIAGASELPEIYAKSKPQQILAWPWNPVSLRPMVAATLIATEDRPEHPFRRMICEEPLLLRFMADASMLRDAGAHGGGSAADETRHYDQVRADIFQILITFINSTQR